MDALKAKGNDAFKRGEFSAAALAYKRAIEAAEAAGEAPRDTASLHSNLSCSLLKLGHAQESLEEAHRCTEMRPDWNKGWFRTGESLFALRRYEEAEEAYRKSLELAPDDATVKRCLLLSLEAQQGVFFRQLYVGRDFCVGRGKTMVESQIFRSAQQMRNFIYLVGDATTREVVVVDAAWDVEGILRVAESERVKLVGAVVTHCHVDHVGGTPPPPFDSLGVKVPGIREMARQHGLKVYAHRLEAAVLRWKNDVPADAMVEMEDGSSMSVGDVSMKFIHTPGHTPGSQCIHIESASGHEDGLLISGDTLFIGSCGRLDLPECNAHAMWGSLQKKLAALPDDTRVYPGHDYGGSYTTIGKERSSGMLRPITEEEWQAMHSKGSAAKQAKQQWW